MAINITGGVRISGGTSITTAGFTPTGIYFNPSLKASSINLLNSNYTMNFDNVPQNSVAIGFTNGEPSGAGSYVAEFQVSSVGPLQEGTIKVGAAVVTGSGSPSNYVDSDWYGSFSTALGVLVYSIDNEGTTSYGIQSPASGVSGSFNLTSKIGIVTTWNGGGLYTNVFIDGVYKGSYVSFSYTTGVVPYAAYQSSSATTSSQGQVTIYSDLDTMQYKTQYQAAYPGVQSWPAAA